MTHLREIPDSRLLVSIHHCWNKYATMEIFDLQIKGKAKRVYSLDRVFGSNYRNWFRVISWISLVLSCLELFLSGLTGNIIIY